MIRFKEITTYGSAESPYLVSDPINSFRQDGEDGIMAFPSWLKFCVMLHDLSLVIIEYKVSYFEGMWSFDYV